MTEIPVELSEDSLLLENWRRQGNRIDIEIGPGDGFFQYFRTLNGNPEALNRIALLLIDPHSRINQRRMDILRERFGHVIPVEKDALTALRGVSPASVDLIDVNNVFGAPGLPIQPVSFISAARRILAQGGTLAIRETNTPDIYDPHTSSQLYREALRAFGNAQLIKGTENPFFASFQATARPESYGIVAHVS